MTLEIHPAAELFPLMSEDEFAGLVEDIRTFGLREPIVLYGGKVLDGRNRLRACEELNITPKFREWPNSESPEAYVVSKNLHRRHLSTRQKALVGARIATRKREDTLIPGGPKAANRLEPQKCGSSISNAEAAQMLNISENTIVDAKTILRDGTPEEIAAVESGEAAVSTTARDIRQRKVVEEKGAPSKRPAGPRIAALKDRSAEDLAAKGWEMEQSGMAADEVAAELHINPDNYRRLRDVWLLKGCDLFEKDRIAVEGALRNITETQTIRPHYEAVKPLVDAMWGSGYRDPVHHEKTIKNRLNHFETAFGAVVDGCSWAPKVEIPYLSAQRAEKALSEIRAAQRALNTLHDKIKEHLS